MVSALEELPGVKKALASYPEKKAIVTYDKSTVSVEKICQKLLKVGYVANLKTNNKKTPTDTSAQPSENLDHEVDDLICFCFEYTRQDIEQDYIQNMNSTIMTRIATEKKAGGCNCATKNPKGR